MVNIRAAAFIFARGGSKGLTDKNIRPLLGKPLIAWSIEHAIAVNRIERVFVSTDSEEIMKVARQYGAEVPFQRPVHLSQDDSPEWLAWRHALNYLKDKEGWLPDVMISVPATSPLRLSIDIENCLDEFEKGDVDAIVTVTESHKSPYFNMVKKNKDGTVTLLMPSQLGLSRRQDAPTVYDISTVAYAIRPDFVFTHNSLFEGKVRAVHVPLERSIDIDTMMDFKMVEFFLAERKKIK